MSKLDIIKDEITYYVLVKKGRRHFDPQYLSAGLTTVQWIFPILEANAVGTLDEESNGIVFIKFNGYGKDPECRVIAKKFSSMVYGPFIYRFSPDVTDNMIVYSKTRDAIIADVKTGNAFYVEFDIFPNDYIFGIRFLDPQKNLFVVVKSIKNDKSYRDDSLHVMSLEDQRFIDTGWSVPLGETYRISSNFPLYNAWFVHDTKLFVYNNGRILCTDGSQPVSHPFSEIFNSNSDHTGNIKDLAIHPTLPFGVMIEDRVSGGIYHKLTIVCWEAKKPKEQIVVFSDVFEPLAPLFGLKRMALAYQSFSPDGSWYVVGCLAPEAETTPEKPKDPFFIA